MTIPLIELTDVTKRFGQLRANDSINLTVRTGEIHAIVGENGAGKSTLMKILSGIHAPDEGRVRLKGADVAFNDPEQAMRHGIGMVHQHFSLVPSLTVAENVVLSHPPKRAGILLRKEAEKRVRGLAEQYGLPVDPRRRVRDCRVGVQQRVEILKALYRDPDILILDEPTAVLTPQETGYLIDNLRMLRARSKTIIFITHKLKEVMALADRVTVMRAGRTHGTLDVNATTPAELAALMVGREVFLNVQREPTAASGEVLSLRNVWCRSETGGWLVKDVSLALRRGEILGIAGVEGNGQSELIEVVAGLRRPDKGRVIALDLDVTPTLSPGAMRARGVAHIPEDRIAQGLAVEGSVKDNLIMGAHALPPLAKGPWIDQSVADVYAQGLISTFDIRASSIDMRAGVLSGGNMQKAIIARELDREPQLVIAAHPTRGVDVGSAEFIYAQLMRQRARAAVLLVSSDLDEILRLSDRIVVMFHGAIMAELTPDSATAERLGLLMAGMDDNERSRGGDTLH